VPAVVELEDPELAVVVLGLANLLANVAVLEPPPYVWLLDLRGVWSIEIVLELNAGAGFRGLLVRPPDATKDS